MVKIIIGVVIAAIVVIGGLIILNNPSSSTQTNVVETTNTFSFTIEGEVSKQGTYILEEETTMADLIDAAGGLTNNADELSYFDDAELVSGTTYYIAGKYDSTDICSKDAIKKVNINSDSSDKMMEINGISSSVASSIVSYRQENGTFRTLEDLLKVYGIGKTEHSL